MSTGRKKLVVVLLGKGWDIKENRLVICFLDYGYDVWRMMRKFVFFGVGVAGSRDDLSANERICI